MRERTLSAAHYRSIVDCICGMSDSEALMRSQWHTGSEVPGMFSLGVLHWTAGLNGQGSPGSRVSSPEESVGDPRDEEHT